MTPLAITTRDYPALAAEAARIYTVRAQHAKDLAAVGDAEAPAAADGARVMRALAAIWKAVVERKPTPELRTSHAEIRAELAQILAKLVATPGTGEELERFERIKALAWHHRPWSAAIDQPHILMLHETNQELRRRLRPPERQAA
jgi:hypothetical protein